MELENSDEGSLLQLETHIEGLGLLTEKEIHRIRGNAEQSRQSYLSRMTTLLSTIQSLSGSMDEVLQMVSEIEEIRRQQAIIERQCELMEQMGDVVPEVFELSRSVDALETRIGGTKHVSLGEEGLCKSVDGKGVISRWMIR